MSLFCDTCGRLPEINGSRLIWCEPCKGYHRMCESCRRTFDLVRDDRTFVNEHPVLVPCALCGASFKTTKWSGDRVLGTVPCRCGKKKHMLCLPCKKLLLFVGILDQDVTVLTECPTRELFVAAKLMKVEDRPLEPRNDSDGGDDWNAFDDRP